MFVKECATHGKLTREQVNLTGKNSKQLPRYKCKKCQKVFHAANYLKNKERLLEKQRIYRAKYPEKRKALRKRYSERLKRASFEQLEKITYHPHHPTLGALHGNEKLKQAYKNIIRVNSQINELISSLEKKE